MGMKALKHDLVQMVKDNTQNILHGHVVCDYTFCPKCHQEVDSFKLHEKRTRIFLVLVENIVNRVLSLITRWKCPSCGKTFTLYPEFALPYKRYVLPSIMDRCWVYLEDDSQAYRRAVTSDNAEFYHQESSEDGSCPVLAHSTLHRWITSLSGLLETMRCALEHIKQKAPHTGIFRKMAALRIPGKKFRSQHREKQLLRCLRLLLVHDKFIQIFSTSIFPKFATMNNWS